MARETHPNLHRVGGLQSRPVPLPPSNGERELAGILVDCVCSVHWESTRYHIAYLTLLPRGADSPRSSPSHLILENPIIVPHAGACMRVCVHVCG